MFNKYYNIYFSDIQLSLGTMSGEQVHSVCGLKKAFLKRTRSSSILKLTFFSHFLRPVSTACFRQSLLLSLPPPTRPFLSPPSSSNFQNTMFSGLFGETVEINKLEGSRTTLLRTTAGSSWGKTNKKAGCGDGSVVSLLQCQAQTVQNRQYTLNPQLNTRASGSSDEDPVQNRVSVSQMRLRALKNRGFQVSRSCCSFDTFLHWNQYNVKTYCHILLLSYSSKMLYIYGVSYWLNIMKKISLY